MWKKIKYLIDNLTDKEDQELKDKNIQSRRKFLFTLPALVTVPLILKPTLETILSVGGKEQVVSALQVSSVSGMVYDVPGLTSLETWREYNIRIVAKAFDVSEHMVGIGFKKPFNNDNHRIYTYEDQENHSRQRILMSLSRRKLDPKRLPL